MKLLALLAILGLGACTMCPTDAQLASLQTQRQQQPSQQQQGLLTPQCRTVIDSLQAQDTYLRGLVYTSTASISSKQERARTVQANLQAGLGQLPSNCPEGLTSQLAAEVNQRIGQIDSYLASGVWQGPVG
jgi:hypothetical protein